jgi:protein disulfide-isomerase A6
MFLVSFVLTSFIFVGICSTSSFTSDPLIELSPSNLTSSLVDWTYDYAVMFYAPWCKYCKQLAPSMEIISQELRKNKDLMVGKMNCEKDKESGENMLCLVH